MALDKKVRLWDGRKYDVAILNDKYPELGKYALTHDRLEDTVPSVTVEVRKGKKPVSFLVMASLYVVLLLVIARISLASGVPISTVAWTIVVVCAVLLLASSASSVEAALHSSRTFRVQDGVVQVRSLRDGLGDSSVPPIPDACSCRL